MRIHILGICGTFMGGIAALARELGVRVEGSDANVYPPMSDQLRALGVTLQEGWSAAHLQPAPDLVVVGNALSRGNPSVEYMLDAGLPYVSGPQWLGENVLRGREVLAVAGTHGKTTTSSLLAHLLDAAGLRPGFLIGGVPGNFGVSARLHGPAPSSGFARRLLGKEKGNAATPFVVEADEYDTAFFDKRSKFVHYRPRVAILNNLEYDHADIFPDVAAIQRQFHHLVRTIPGNGRLIVNAEDARLAEVLAMGCWTPVETFGIDAGDWRARMLAEDGSAFAVVCKGRTVGDVRWNLLGRHNVMNALAALAAAKCRGRRSGPAVAGLCDVRKRQAPDGIAGRGERRARVRRFRAPSDRDRVHPCGPARESGGCTHTRRAGTALQFHACRCARGGVGTVAGRCRYGGAAATFRIAVGCAAGNRCAGRARIRRRVGRRPAGGAATRGAAGRPRRVHVERRFRERAAAIPRRVAGRLDSGA